MREAGKKRRDVVIFDTAGRLAIDEALMQELEDIKGLTKPDNIFLVVRRDGRPGHRAHRQ